MTMLVLTKAVGAANANAKMMMVERAL